MYDALVGRWLWQLFRNGPSSLGFWKGLADEDICARIARNSQAADWITVQGDVAPSCTAMIQREYAAFSVTVHTVMYLVTLLVLLRTLKQWWEMRMQAKTITSALMAMQRLPPLLPALLPPPPAAPTSTSDGAQPAGLAS